MHRVCGRAQAPTAGLQHAPLALGDDDERVTRGLRIEGLAAAAASTFSCGSLSLLDRLPPPPSSARTARPYLPITHGVEHGEPAAESAVVGLAGTVGGEQQGRTRRSWPTGSSLLRVSERRGSYERLSKRGEIFFLHP